MLIFFLLCTFGQSPDYILILKNGKTLQCPEIERRETEVIIKGPNSYSIPLEMVDWEKTELANTRRQVAQENKQQPSPQQPGRPDPERKLEITNDSVSSFAKDNPAAINKPMPTPTRNEEKSTKENNREVEREFKEIENKNRRYQSRYDSMKRELKSVEATLEGYKKQLQTHMNTVTHPYYQENTKAYYERKIKEWEAQRDNVLSRIRELEREAVREGAKIRQFR